MSNSQTLQQFFQRYRFLGSVLVMVGCLTVGTTQLVNPTLKVVPFVEKAEDEALGIAVAASIAYGTARVINAVLSLVTDLDFQVSFIGNGTSFSPLKILEPVDDFIETVSEGLLILAVTATLFSFGFQPMTALGLLGFGFGLLIRIFGDLFRQQAWLYWSRQFMLFGSFGILLPIIFAFSIFIADVTTRVHFENAYNQLTGVSQQVEEIESSSERVLTETPDKVGDSNRIETTEFENDTKSDNQNLESVIDDEVKIDESDFATIDQPNIVDDEVNSEETDNNCLLWIVWCENDQNSTAETSEEISDENNETPNGDVEQSDGFFGTIGDWILGDVGEQIESLSEMVDSTVGGIGHMAKLFVTLATETDVIIESFIKIIALLILKTLVVPLLFTFLGYRFIKSLFPPA